MRIEPLPATQPVIPLLRSTWSRIAKRRIVERNRPALRTPEKERTVRAIGHIAGTRQGEGIPFVRTQRVAADVVVAGAGLGRE